MRARDRMVSWVAFSAVTSVLGLASALAGCEEDKVPGILGDKCTVDEQCRGGMTCHAKCGCYPADQECPIPDAGGDAKADGVTEGGADAPPEGGDVAPDTGTDAGADTGAETGGDSGIDADADGGLDAADAPGDG